MGSAVHYTVTFTFSSLIYIVAYSPNDHYARKAKKEGFEARSVYKLEEIDQKNQVFRKGDQVIDLGASPGSWSQYASRAIGDKGRLLGIDLTEIRLNIHNATFVQQDIYTADWPSLFAQANIDPPVDAVISDMAPKTTGIRNTDQARSFDLCMMALEVARKHLRPGGVFVAKFFDGPDFQEYRAELMKSFASVKVLRPQSTRKESKEIFFIAKGFKPAA